MGYNNQSGNGNGNGNGNNGSTNDGWKAQGFLNFYLPAKGDGKRRKLGAIPLKESRASEKQLLAWLNEDPTRVAAILSKLELEYQSATPSETAAFDLG